MRLGDIVQHLEVLAPPAMAEAWDNVGLLVGDPAADVTRAMLCIDYTTAVAEEAKVGGCELVIAYHPPLFQPIKRLTASGATALLYDAARRGVAIYSPHTALDVAQGGTNDVLADLVGLTDCRPLRANTPKANALTLVTFVPRGQVERVADALFAAGAGVIGNYADCSFRTEGVGTFYGNPGTSPAVGEAGKFQRTDEVKIETVVPLARVGDVVNALRATHPYQTPAFDLVTLTAPPTGAGIGRVGQVDAPVRVTDLLHRIKKGLGIDRLLVAGPTDRTVSTVAVCAGAGGSLLDDALAVRADLYLTGELRHHDALRAAAAGITVVCTLHSHSERVTLKRLVERLTAALSSVNWTVSTVDDDPFAIR